MNTCSGRKMLASLSLSFSLSLFSFVLPGIGVVATTFRRLARPTTHCIIKWSALGLVQTMVQNYPVCPEFPSWHPPLYSKHRNNPGLVSAPLRPNSPLVPGGCRHTRLRENRKGFPLQKQQGATPKRAVTNTSLFGAPPRLYPFGKSVAG